MADVVIRGIKMPIACADKKYGTCPVYERCLARLNLYNESLGSPAKMDAYYDAVFLGRQEGCPLVEVKTGKWLKKSDEYNYEDVYECSVCHEPYIFEDGDHPKEHKYNYCPNCGAVMEASNG